MITYPLNYSTFRPLVRKIRVYGYPMNTQRAGMSLTGLIALALVVIVIGIVALYAYRAFFPSA
jgi:hypothetical protein